MYPLNLLGWQGLQVIEHAKALVGTVNTANFEFDSSADGTYNLFSISYVFLIYSYLDGIPCLY